MRRRGAAAAVGAAAILVLSACGSGTPSFTEVPDPRPGDLRVDPDADTLPADYRAPAPAGGTRELAYGPDPFQRVDLHLPARTPAPVVLYLHSGGWIGGRREDIPEMVRRFIERGYVVASADYRLAPESPFPAAVEDAKRVVRFLKSGGGGDAVDRERVVVYGASAGGLLAAFVGATVGEFEPTDLPPELAAVDSSVSGIVSAVGPTDLRAMYIDGQPWPLGAVRAFAGCDRCAPMTLAVASPLSWVEPGRPLPPAYWAYGELDLASVPATQGRPIAERWGEVAGVEQSWYDLVEGAGHNLDHTLVNQRWIERFVDDAVGGGP